MSKRVGRAIRVDVIGGACLAAATVGGYLLGVDPGIRARVERQREEMALETKRQEATVAESNSRADLVNRIRLTKEVEELPFQLESAGTLNQRMVALTHLAEGAKLEVSQISPGKAEQRDLYTSVPIKLSGACTYGAFSRFLAELKGTFPDTEVVEFKLTGTPNNKKTEAAFTLSCLWYAAPVATAGAESAAGR